MWYPSSTICLWLKILRPYSTVPVSVLSTFTQRVQIQPGRNTPQDQLYVCAAVFHFKDSYQVFYFLCFSWASEFIKQRHIESQLQTVLVWSEPFVLFGRKLTTNFMRTCLLYVGNMYILSVDIISWYNQFVSHFQKPISLHSIDCGEVYQTWHPFWTDYLLLPARLVTENSVSIF